VKHYLNWGYKEGRKIIFNARLYLANHADLRAAFGDDTASATKHYINYGSKENRVTNGGVYDVATNWDEDATWQ
jgi:hypothetical protein